MKSKKWFVLLLSAILILVLVSACSGGNKETSGSSPKASGSSAPASSPAASGSAAPSESAPPEPVTIDFWHVWSDGAMKELYDGLVADFMKEYPHVTVKPLAISFWDYWTKLSTAIAGGSGPDLAFNDTSTAISRAKSGVIVNLDPYIDQINLADYFPVLVDRVKVDGSMYAMPNDTDIRLLYYNKAAFREVGLDPEKPPTNWDELEQYADKLTKFNDKKMLDRVGFSPTMGNSHFWTLAWTNGGDFWDDNLKPTYNRPENVEALAWIKKIQDKYGAKALQAFNVQNGALGMSPFIAERVAMIIDVNNLYGDIKRTKPDLEFGVAAIPFNKQQATWSAGFDLEIVDNGDKAKQDAAWLLMKYLTSEEVQKKIHAASGSLVSNMKAATAPEFMEDPVWKLVVEQMQYARFIEYVDGSPAWHGNLQPKVDAVIQGKQEPQAALEEAQKAIEQELENYEATN